MRMFGLACAIGALVAGCGGSGWGSVSGAPELTGLIDVWAFSPTDVWFLDGSSTVQRYDGSTWSTLETPSSAGLGCIFALSTSDVWLCAGGEVLHYDGAEFTSTDVSSTTGLGELSGLWASSPTDIWAVGGDAIVAHYDGNTWSGQVAGSPFKSSIWGSGPHDVYALGTFDLMHYDGSGWSEVDTGGAGGGDDGQVWGTAGSDVWVMTGSSEVAHYDGQAWDLVDNVNFIGDLTAVWGEAPDDLWAAGGAGSIAHYDGSSWDKVTHQTIGAPYLRQFLAVHGSSGDDIWAVGRQLGEGGSTALIYHN